MKETVTIDDLLQSIDGMGYGSDLGRWTQYHSVMNGGTSVGQTILTPDAAFRLLTIRNIDKLVGPITPLRNGLVAKITDVLESADHYIIGVTTEAHAGNGKFGFRLSRRADDSSEWRYELFFVGKAIGRFTLAELENPKRLYEVLCGFLENIYTE